MNRRERAGENLPEFVQAMNWDQVVPVQSDEFGGAGWVPARVARLAYEAYAGAGHGSQSFETLHLRSGFSWGELITLLRGSAHYRGAHRETCWRECGKEKRLP